MKKILLLALAAILIMPLSADDKTVNAVLKSYEAEGAKNFNAEKGKQMWTQEFTVEGEKRTCATCHMADLTKTGKHANTGKLIEPMSAKVNPERYTDPKFIEKWFKRNCKWTLGRECTPQEKGDYLLYLSQN